MTSSAAEGCSERLVLPGGEGHCRGYPEYSNSPPAFYPQYPMNDRVPTPRRQTQECLEAARDAGLTRVKVGQFICSVKCDASEI